MAFFKSVCELGKSTTTNVINMGDVWPKLNDFGQNILSVTAYWKLMKPNVGLTS